MKIGIVAPSPVPPTRGGAERAWSGLAARDRRADAPRGRAGEAPGARDHAARAARGLPRLRPPRRQPLRPGDHLEVPGVDRGPPVPHRLDVPPAARPLRHVPHVRDARTGRADCRRGRRPGAVPRRAPAAERARRLLRPVGPGAAGRRSGPPRADPAVAGRPPTRALARRGRAVPAGGAPPPRPLRDHRGPPRVLPAGHRPDHRPRPVRPPGPDRLRVLVPLHGQPARRPQATRPADRRHGPRAPGAPAPHRGDRTPLRGAEAPRRHRPAGEVPGLRARP